MKNQKILLTFFIFGMLSIFAENVSSQTSSIQFKSGISAVYKTVAFQEGKEIRNLQSMDEWESVRSPKPKDILHRRFVDIKNGIFFAYDLEITRNTDSKKFTVEIKSLPYKKGSNPIAEKFEAEKLTLPSNPKWQNVFVVDAGDVVKLDILENPNKKIKVTDYVKIYDGKPLYISFSELAPTRDFTIDDVFLKLLKFEVFADGKMIAQMGGGGYAPNVYFTLPKKGRFIFSPFPRPGYDFKKIGTAIDNKLYFTHEGIKYAVVSGSNILAEGNWNIWVLYDPNYEKKYKSDNLLSPEFGGADKIEYLFKEIE